MGNLNYESTEETLGGYEPLPVGTYYATIIESEVKQTANGAGTGISLKFEIMSGDYKGRTLYNWINYQHANQQAQQIGRKELNTIMQACGMAPGTVLEDTAQLHGIAMVIDVKMGKDKDGNPRNEIKGYASAEEQPAQQEVPANNSAPASSGSATPSWKR